MNIRKNIRIVIDNQMTYQSISMADEDAGSPSMISTSFKERIFYFRIAVDNKENSKSKLKAKENYIITSYGTSNTQYKYKIAPAKLKHSGNRNSGNTGQQQ